MRDELEHAYVIAHSMKHASSYLKGELPVLRPEFEDRLRALLGPQEAQEAVELVQRQH